MKYKGHMPSSPILLNHLTFTFISNSSILQFIIISIILGIIYITLSSNKDIANITYRSLGSA